MTHDAQARINQESSASYAASGHGSDTKRSGVGRGEYERIYTLWVTLPNYVRVVYPWFVPA